VSERLKFIILPGLILLGLETRDGLCACPHIELKLLSIHFGLPRFMFQDIHRARACCQLRFETLPPQRYGLYFHLDLPDLLLSILKDQKLFQLRMHERTRY
jgi:hypothetical protein